jgi:hypothetical protein
MIAARQEIRAIETTFLERSGAGTDPSHTRLIHAAGGIAGAAVAVVRLRVDTLGAAFQHTRGTFARAGDAAL